LSPQQKKTLEDIKQWLHEYNIFEFNEIEDEGNAFTIETRLKSKPTVLPIYIIGSKKTDEKIMLTWFWGFAEEDIQSLRMIDMKLKQKFAFDVKYEFQLLNLPLKFYESPEDIKGIHTENYINVDELSKDRLWKNINELGSALTIIGQKFEKYFPFPSKFDPSFHV
jgi:hypothetical protein